jgi:hypothetical protein
MKMYDYVLAAFGFIIFVFCIYLWFFAPCEVIKTLNLSVPGRCL